MLAHQQALSASSTGSQQCWHASKQCQPAALAASNAGTPASSVSQQHWQPAMLARQQAVSTSNQIVCYVMIVNYFVSHCFKMCNVCNIKLLCKCYNLSAVRICPFKQVLRQPLFASLLLARPGNGNTLQYCTETT